MNAKEIDAFEKSHGLKPMAVPVAIDALAVYVHKDNPIKGLSIQQVDAVFSATRRCGGKAEVNRWGELGLSGDWGSRAISIYGRNSVSGTYGFYKEVALCRGDFRKTVQEQPGSASVVQSVTTGLNAIGYSGIGYKTSGVRALPLGPKDSNAYVEPDAANAISGKYPLARVLYVYANKRPNQPLAPLEREFFKMVLSKEGQTVVVRDGFVPMPAKMAADAVAAMSK